MLTPRHDPELIRRTDLRFIGGTENFDLWWRTQGDAATHNSEDYQLRIQRVAGGSLNWDVFKLPLRDNTEVGTSLHPAERGVTGYWHDVSLSWEDVEQVEIYLQCFAPWVREDTNDGA